MNLYLPGRRSQPASAYKLPLGGVVCDCWSCNRPVHTAELTFWWDRGIVWGHRSCRRFRENA